MKRVLLIIPWFGRWPEWTPFFLQSCRYNPTIDWLLVTDCAPPSGLPVNVRIERHTFIAYRDMVAAKTGVPLDWRNPYKLCDLKPLLGFLHEAAIEGYDYWGYGDIDVIYGDIRKFYTAEVLAHDVISTHDTIVGGHFAVFRNTPQLVRAFRKVSCWKSAISDHGPRSFDETHFSRLFLPRDQLRWRDRIRYPHVACGYFEERYSTDLRPLKWIDGSSRYPSRWFWDRGRLTSDISGAREFLYVHFTHWNSAQWTSQAVAPWKKVDRIVQMAVDPMPDRFAVSANGFEAFPALAERPERAAVRSGRRTSDVLI